MCDAQCPAEFLQIGHQVCGGVVRSFPQGATPPATPLIEKHGAKTPRIEEPPLGGIAPAAGSAVQEHDGKSVAGTALFPVQFVPLPHRQPLARGTTRGKQAIGRKTRRRHDQDSIRPLRMATRASSAAFWTLSFCLMW